MSDRIKVITEKCEGKKVLDIGCCGSDYHLHKKISEASERVVGIDMDEEKVKEMDRKGYEVYYRNAEEFDLGEKFQVVVAGELIEHLENPGTFLDSVKEHLVKKGKLILTTPNLQSAWIIKQNFCGGEGNKNHILGFTKSLLSNLLKKKGFNILKIRNIDRNEEFIPLRGKFVNFFLPNFFKVKILCIAEIQEEGTSE